MTPQQARRPVGEARERIVNAAIQALADGGFGGMRLQAVADAVGIQKGSLFHHFSGKADLTAAAVREVQKRFLVLLAPLEEEPSGEQLDRFLSSTIAFGLDQPATAQLALRTFIDPVWPPEVFQSPESLEGHIFETICRWLERAQKNGVVRKLSPRVAAIQLMGLILMLPAASQRDRTSIGDRETILRETLDTARAALLR